MNVFWYTRSITSDAKKTGQSDFVENPKSKKERKLPSKVSHNDHISGPHGHISAGCSINGCKLKQEQCMQYAGYACSAITCTNCNTSDPECRAFVFPKELK